MSSRGENMQNCMNLNVRLNNFSEQIQVNTGKQVKINISYTFFKQANALITHLIFKVMPRIVLDWMLTEDGYMIQNKA